jgi:hypothetical protein
MMKNLKNSDFIGKNQTNIIIKVFLWIIIFGDIYFIFFNTYFSPVFFPLFQLATYFPMLFFWLFYLNLIKFSKKNINLILLHFTLYFFYEFSFLAEISEISKYANDLSPSLIIKYVLSFKYFFFMNNIIHMTFILTGVLFIILKKIKFQKVVISFSSLYVILSVDIAFNYYLIVYKQYDIYFNGIVS